MTKKKQNANGTAFMKSKNEQLFALVKDTQTEKVKIVVGNNVVSSKEFNSFDDAEKYIGCKPYELIINTACLFMQFSLTQNDKQNENEKV